MELKEILNNNYQTKKNTLTIQTQLGNIKQNNSEAERFIERIEDLINELNNVQIKELGESNKETICRINDYTALNTLKHGINDKFKNAIYAANPKTFTEAVNIIRDMDTQKEETRVLHFQKGSFNNKKGYNNNYRQDNRNNNWNNNWSNNTRHYRNNIYNQNNFHRNANQNHNIRRYNNNQNNNQRHANQDNYIRRDNNQNNYQRNANQNNNVRRDNNYQNYNNNRNRRVNYINSGNMDVVPDRLEELRDLDLNLN